MSIDTRKLKRYKAGFVHSNNGPGYISMLASGDGEYVRLEDVTAALTEAKQRDNRALAESVFNIPVPTRGFHEGWRDEEIWQWALCAAAAHILGTTQSEAEKLLAASSTPQVEAKRQAGGDA